MRTLAQVAAAFLVCGSMCAVAKPKEPIGTWRFQDDNKSVKVVTIAGSIGAWPAGSFSKFLGEVCSNAEIVNRSKTGYGARALKHRFRQQVLRNRRVPLKDSRFSYWLIYGGGLNSIGTPGMTIKYQVETFRLAHQHGIQVVGLSLGPWGEERDRRWAALAGLRYLRNTRKVVDFIMGRLSRDVALQGYISKEERSQTAWNPGELPDISVDLYDSDLRDRNAALRSVSYLTRRYRRSWKLRRRFPDEAKTVAEAAAIPRWYLRKELQSFDHIHPNSEGHRLIAQTTCPLLPSEWKCRCDALASLRWVKGKGITQVERATP